MRDATFGIDQCRPFACEAAAIDFDEADFDDAIVEEAAAGRLEVEKYYAFVKHRDDLSANGAPATAGTSPNVADRSRDVFRGTPHVVRPARLQAVGWRGDRESSDQAPFIV